MPTRPEIVRSEIVARSRLFRIEELHLRFANGVERVYERLPGRRHRAVMVVAVNERDEVLLIREYAAGFHDYLLTLPKGAIEGDETIVECANRELQEEAGFAARRLEIIKELSIAPGHMGFSATVVLARDLYESRLEGDEPEPIEVVPWPRARLAELFMRADFDEARAIAALYLADLRIRGVAG